MTASSTAAPSRGGGADTGRVAVVFPGQGSQSPGMASPWRDDPAYQRWAEADEVLGRDVTRLGLHADADELRDPVSCQLALFVHHAVLLEAWRRSGGTAAVAAGHSLGEYSALLAAGVVDFAGGLRLVEARALATRAAAQRRPGGMAACLGADQDAVNALAAATGVHVANDNAPGQTIVAGDEASVQRFVDGARALGKVRRLDVGAAYHSPLMAPAAELFAPALDTAVLDEAALPVVANVDAQPHQRADEWRSLLLRQLTAPVLWRQTAVTLASLVTGVVELGATPVLAGMLRRTAPSLTRHAVQQPSDLGVAA